MVTEVMDFITAADPEVGQAIRAEYDRQQQNIELIASENIVSAAVLAAAGTVLTNKYAEGYPGKRYYGGCQCVDVVETIAIERAKKLFGANYANVQPHSGAQANFAVYQAPVPARGHGAGHEPGPGRPPDPRLPGEFFGQELQHGGLRPGRGRPHRLRPGAGSGPKAQAPHDPGRRLRLPPDHRLQDLRRHRPRGGRLSVCGHGPHRRPGGRRVPPLPHPLRRRGVHHHPQDPSGPPGAACSCANDEAIAKKLNSAIFPGSQGGPLEHIIAAKAVALGEALKPEFKTYQQQIVKNAAVLAQTIMEGGLDLVSGGTDNHLMLVDLRPAHLTGKEMEHRLDEVYITVNKNAIPNDPEKPFVTSGIRVGTPAVTSRGFTEEDMKVVGRLICQAAQDDFASKVDDLRAQVKALTGRYPLYQNV